MASPKSGRLGITPGSRVLKTPLSDDAIWKRLREAGFDEDSIKRRDKAALIAYIAKLETEINDHQHHMGLLIMERKEWVSKYEQIKSSAESAEFLYKRDQASHSSALAEAKKREENLKKALGIEKECVRNIEKALHEMRAEYAETKVAAESKLAEAQSMVEDAQKKYTEAEVKLHAAESLEAEANRYHRIAERKLHEVEAREDDLRRRIMSFKSDCDAKEKDILLERRTLSERQKTLQQSQERLLDGQALLNQREDYIFNRSQELTRLEKELEASKANIEKELGTLNNERSILELNVASLSAREEAVIKRECELNKKEEELLIQQQKLASKESDGIQQVIVKHEAALKARKSEFEAELELKRKLVEEEMESKRRAWELRELDLSQREGLILEKEHDLEFQSSVLADKEKDLTERANLLDEKERSLLAAEREVELKKTVLQKEKEEINSIKLDLQKSVVLLEDRKKQIEMQKGELENCTNKRREEIESYLREKEKAFEEEKKKELQHIASLRETVAKEMEQVNLELQKLDAERREINLDRERRDNEWAELNNSIEELKVQRQKLEKQREFLHADREEILARIEQMKKLEDLKIAPDHLTVPEIQESNLKFSRQKVSAKRFLKQQTDVHNVKLDLNNKIDVNDDGIGLDLSSKKGSEVISPPVSTPLSWLKRCADSLLERTLSNKKRKQQSVEITNPCMLSTQQNTPDNERGLMSLSQTPGGAEETMVYIDKIITVQEITSADGGRVIEESQYQQEIISEKIEERLEDHGNSKSLENGKAKQTVE